MARYINGLRMEIQDEMSMLSPRTIEEAYQIALKAEGKILRKKLARGRGTFKGKESQGSRGGSIAPKSEVGSSSRQQTPSYGDARGRGGLSKGQGGQGRGREF